MHRGWVKLWRKSRESIVFTDELWRLWCYCLMRANHKPTDVFVHGLADPIKVGAGQFITGRHALHEDLYPKKRQAAVSARTLWRRLKLLERLGNLVLETSSRFTIVTVCNFETYNTPESQFVQVNVQPVSSRCPAGVQPVSTEKNVKNDKHSKNAKKKKPATAGDPPADLLKLIDGWNALGPDIVKQGNGARRDPAAEAVLKGWRRAMRNPEQADALADLDEVLAAIRRARFCHRQGWFTLAWLFGRNRNGEANICKLLAGGHDGDDPGEPEYQPIRFHLSGEEEETA